MEIQKEKRKVKLISFDEKIKAIELIDKGKSRRKVAEELGIGRSTLFYAVKNREMLKREANKSGSRKRMSNSKHPQIEQAVLDYINEAQANGERITGSSLQSIALEAAAKLEIQDFSGSNGWLFSFFKRNNLNIKEMNEGAELKKKVIVNIDESHNTSNDIKEEFLYSNDELNYDWRNWCRFCAHTETLPEIDHNVMEIIIKLLNNEIENIKICTACNQSFNAIYEMLNKYKYVENMFIELDEYDKENFMTSENVLNIRDRYEIKNSTEIETINIKEESETYNDGEDDDDPIEEWVNDDEAENEEAQRDITKKSPKKTIKRVIDDDMFNYNCHICNETFDKMCFLSNHTRKLHDCLPQVACSCGRYLATWDSLMAHKRKHSSEPRDWICDLCNASFITKNGLTIHIKFKHQSQQQPFHLCTICGKEFKDAHILKNHERTHLPAEERYIYECNICFKKFTQRGSLKIHISSVHQGQKSILCHLCSKSFSSNHYLKIHILTHSIENVRCDICDSVFKNRISLQNHKKKIHKPKELLNFSCSQCDKRFHNRNHLERHMPLHTGERNYKCTYEGCDVAFKWEKDLRNHTARHNGEKKHKCLWCDRMFVDSGNMRKHKLRYHAEELAEFELKYGKRRRMKDLILENDEMN